MGREEKQAGLAVVCDQAALEVGARKNGLVVESAAAASGKTTAV